MFRKKLNGQISDGQTTEIDLQQERLKIEHQQNEEYYADNIEKLDKLYSINELHDFDLGKLMTIKHKDKSLGPQSNEYMSLMYLQTILKLGAEPCSINDNWYKYSIPMPNNGSNWHIWTGFRPTDGHTVSYTPSLPFKVTRLLEKLIVLVTDVQYYVDDYDSRNNYKTDFDATKVFEVSIFSPSPFLGMRDETRNQAKAVRADPLLIAKIIINHKEYYFRLATWDLASDLMHNT